MKTVSLSQEAYDRLRAWKSSPRESLSQVVLKSVPKPGTAGELDAAFESWCRHPRAGADEAAATIAWANRWENDAGSGAGDATAPDSTSDPT